MLCRLHIDCTSCLCNTCNYRKSLCSRSPPPILEIIMSATHYLFCTVLFFLLSIFFLLLLSAPFMIFFASNMACCTSAHAVRFTRYLVHRRQNGKSSSEKLTSVPNAFPYASVTTLFCAGAAVRLSCLLSKNSMCWHSTFVAHLR